MNRLLVLVVLSLLAVFLVTSVAVGAGITKSSTSSKVSPKRDKKKPYKFKTKGSVNFPKKFCAPNAPAPDCIPLICPPGTSNPAYCTKPTAAKVCTGKVKITFKKGKKTLSSKSVSLKPNCKYSSKTTIKKHGKLKVKARFGGNTILAPSSASTKKVRAG